MNSPGPMPAISSLAMEISARLPSSTPMAVGGTMAARPPAAEMGPTDMR